LAIYGNSLSISSISDSPLCDYGWKIARERADTAVRFVRGDKMRRVDRLFDEVSAACQFPYYFGENWAAFAECLGDLYWIHSSCFVLIITKADEVLADEPNDIGAFVESIGDAINAYNRKKGNSDHDHSMFQVMINASDIDNNVITLLSKELGNPIMLRI
jgi:hypothetical protein